MKPDRHDWAELLRLLDLALDMSDAERETWLTALPLDRQAPLRELLSSRAAVETGDFLAKPAGLPVVPADSATATQAGQRIGPYELLRELGRGGMGQVWLARRVDGSFAREVALKLPHAHLLVGGVRERFNRERDILAALDHPHIARFFDAGLGADGQPYLALEAIDGQPITAWCRSQNLPLAARLDLFAQVTGAVSHAHGRFIAHRDIKPANVLVSQAGQVKLLDFGIAKLLAPDDDGGEGGAGGSTALTRAGGSVATPRYAAPEQLAGAPVSVATDVYALGLMLFELLTDSLPPAPGQPVPPPSRAVSDRASRKALTGDLDAIVDRAVQLRPQDRYAGVAALAADLQRHREHRPIQARHLGRWALAWRYARRHRLPVALTSALALALLIGSAAVAWQAHEARAQARRAEAVKTFLFSVFSAADPRVAGGKPDGQTSAKTLLDRISARIDAQFASDPELRIELLRTAAEIYRELGEDAASEALQRRQLALVLQRFGPLHKNALEGRHQAAMRALLRGDLAACRALQVDADAQLRRAGMDHSPLRAQWWVMQGMCSRDQSHQAAARLEAVQRGVALFNQVEPGGRGHVTALAELANEHNSQQRTVEGAAINRQAITLAKALPERNEAELQTLHGNLGLNLLMQGQLAQAAQAFGEAAEIAQRTTGADSMTALIPLSRQARTLHLSGDREGANVLFSRLLTQLDRHDAAKPDATTPDADEAREQAGERLAAEGRPALGLPLLRQAQAGMQRQLMFEFGQRRLQRHLGDALARLGQHDEALSLLQIALAGHEANEPPGNQPMTAARERMGRLLLDMGRFEAARQQLQRAVDEATTKTWSQVALAQAGLARAALAQGDNAAAGRASEAALDTWSKLTGFYDVRMQPYLWRVRAAVLAAQGDAAGAQALRLQALAASQRTDAPESPTVQQPLYLGL